MNVTAKHVKDAKRAPPNGWRWVKLGELCDPTKGSSRIGPFGSSLRKDELSESGIPLIGIENILPNRFEQCFRRFISTAKYSELKDYTVKPGDVLVSTMGTIGRCAIVPDNIETAIIDSHLFRFRLDRSEADPTFICYAINGFPDLIQQLEKKSSGAIMAGLNTTILRECMVPLPPLPEQQRIAGVLREQMAAVEKARTAAQARLDAAMALPASFVSESLTTGLKTRYSLDDCLIEIRNGIGADWSKFPVLGATREGLAPAKEGVGKAPARYKLVDPVTVFYNPMRILLGSIAMVDEGDAPGITSPDYVVVKGKPGILDTRWFYYWFRSAYGAHLVESLSRGAVRERILYNRLSDGEIDLPDYNVQKRVSESMQRVRNFIEPLTKELATINALPAALLRRAFNGEI